MAIADNLKAIQSRIKTAATANGRAAGSVKLLAVSKGMTKSEVFEALNTGHRLFGENRVQEAKAKFADLRKIFPDLELHLIGPLQTNKADDAVALFDVIETLDRQNLADAIGKAIRKAGRVPKLYVEINIGNEAQKTGIAPSELEAFLRYCREECGLIIEGLMCIPPQHEDPVQYFTQLKDLAARHKLKTLSMGMSADFEAAIACGSTQVRVGTAIFGPRTNLPHLPSSQSSKAR